MAAQQRSMFYEDNDMPMHIPFQSTVKLQSNSPSSKVADSPSRRTPIIADSGGHTNASIRQLAIEYNRMQKLRSTLHEVSTGQRHIDNELNGIQYEQASNDKYLDANKRYMRYANKLTLQLSTDAIDNTIEQTSTQVTAVGEGRRKSTPRAGSSGKRSSSANRDKTRGGAASPKNRWFSMTKTPPPAETITSEGTADVATFTELYPSVFFVDEKGGKQEQATTETEKKKSSFKKVPPPRRRLITDKTGLSESTMVSITNPHHRYVLDEHVSLPAFPPLLAELAITTIDGKQNTGHEHGYCPKFGVFRTRPACRVKLAVTKRLAKEKPPVRPRRPRLGVKPPPHDVAMAASIKNLCETKHMCNGNAPNISPHLLTWLRTQQLENQQPNPGFRYSQLAIPPPLADHLHALPDLRRLKVPDELPTLLCPLPQSNPNVLRLGLTSARDEDTCQAGQLTWQQQLKMLDAEFDRREATREEDKQEQLAIGYTGDDDTAANACNDPANPDRFVHRNELGCLVIQKNTLPDAETARKLPYGASPIRYQLRVSGRDWPGNFSKTTSD